MRCWAQSAVRPGELLTVCLRQSKLIISLMIWAPDVCRPGKCTHSAVCINLPFQLRPGRCRSERERERERRGGIIGLGCVLCDWRFPRLRGLESSEKSRLLLSLRSSLHKQTRGKRLRRRVLVWLAYHTRYRQGTYHITAGPQRGYT